MILSPQKISYIYVYNKSIDVIYSAMQRNRATCTKNSHDLFFQLADKAEYLLNKIAQYFGHCCAPMTVA